MEKIRSLSLVLLLLAVFTVAGAGFLEHQAAAALVPKISCRSLGCEGGPDYCLTYSVTNGGLTLSVDCYVKRR